MTASTGERTGERAGVRLDPVERALEDTAAGRPVVVLDAADRENEADLIVPAQATTPDLVGFFVRHTSGVLCAAATGERLAGLAIGPMVARNDESMRTAFTVTVDAARGVTTGICAADRCRTLRVLADPDSRPADLTRPGHVFPLQARAGGVVERPGHTEAGVDLCRLAGRTPVALLAELVDDTGGMLRAPAARAFADEHGFALIAMADLIAHRRAYDRLVERRASTVVPTRFGAFRAYAYRDVEGHEHLALVLGELGTPGELGDGGSEVGPATLVRVRSECLTGDVFGSRRCDCGAQLDAALQRISLAGKGILIYLRGHEGRGIGLAGKLAAYALQDRGRDTVDANRALGLPVDARGYWPAAQILGDLGVRRIRLLTNNPAKAAELTGAGVAVVEREALVVPATPENAGYLAAKRDRLGHLLPADGDVAAVRRDNRPEGIAP